MKQKSVPEDFVVDEIASIEPNGGSFALYRLTKRGLGTPEVVQAVARRWQIDPRKIAFGGLKDRHAVTSQYLTVERGPRRDLAQEHFKLAYLGQIDRPFRAEDIQKNQFAITLRDLEPEAAQAAEAAVEVVRSEGAANYFDHQRFGSVGESGEFIAQTWCRGDHERGLWLLLADPNPHDRPKERADRDFFREHWGQWSKCRGAAQTSPWKEVATHLVAFQKDYRRATERLRPDLLSLYAAAFQSYLWNGLLAAYLRRECRPEQLVDATIGRWTLPLYRSLSAEQGEKLRQTMLPLPAARQPIEDETVSQLLDQVLQPLDLERSQLKFKYPRRTFFSKGDRPAVVPVSFAGHETSPDELHPGRLKFRVAFQLPRGAYATIVIKRLMA